MLKGGYGMRLATSILLAGILVTALGYAMTHHPAQKGVGFTVHYNQIYISQDEHSLDAQIVRYERSDSTWKEVSTYYKRDGSVGAVKTNFSLNDKGIFSVDEKHQRLVLRGERYHTAHHPTADEIKSDPHFVREDSVLGYNTLVQHFADGDGFSEFYLSPELNGVVLKAVYESGEGYQTVVEATQIELGEPSENEFIVPNYPMDTSSYETNKGRLAPK